LAADALLIVIEHVNNHDHYHLADERIEGVHPCDGASRSRGIARSGTPSANRYEGTRHRGRHGGPVSLPRRPTSGIGSAIAATKRAIRKSRSSAHVRGGSRDTRARSDAVAQTMNGGTNKCPAFSERLSHPRPSD
jgi:hypothetical protein